MAGVIAQADRRPAVWNQDSDRTSCLPQSFRIEGNPNPNPVGFKESKEWKDWRDGLVSKVHKDLSSDP